jgi:hypothetical protein
MSKPRQNHGDPAKSAERKRKRRASRAAGLPKAPAPPAQLDHASNPRGSRERRDGERWLARQPEPEVVGELPE